MDTPSQAGSNSASIPDLIAGVKSSMEELGYSTSTMMRLEHVWTRFRLYCEANGIDAFTAEHARSFVSDRYGAVLGDKDASHNVNRAMHLLLDYQSFGMIFKQSHATLKGFSPGYADLFDGFLEYLGNQGTAEKSIATWRSRLFRLEHFLIGHGLDRFGQIELHHVNSYVESLACYSSGTVCATLNILGRLFNYAHENGYHEHTFSDSLPKVRRSKRRRLPTTFSPEEVEAILATVDRENPVGKRNYAMLMLAARLGLRIGDVCRLTFDSLDWDAKRISIIQHKTGNPLELPLLDDVGWAVIDYLKYGRPETSCSHIFVRHTAPFEGLQPSCYRFVVKAIQDAGIHVPADKPRGMHSFRHSLATNLLSQGTKISEISQILGHARPETTEVYVATDIGQLRQCALEVTV